MPMLNRWIACLLPVLALALGACSRDSEAALRTRLDDWFVLDRQLYFKSKRRCTAAMYRVAEVVPRDALPVQVTASTAKAALKANGLSSFRMAGYSPNDLIDGLLLTGRGTFGKEALAAGAQAVDCFRGTRSEGYLRVALTRRGALIAYDRESRGLMVLDPAQMRLFYIAGDVW